MTKEELRELYKTMFVDYPDIVSIKDLTKMLNISRRYAYKLLTDNEIHARKFSNSYKIPKINVINYVLSVDGQFDLKS